MAFEKIEKKNPTTLFSTVYNGDAHIDLGQCLDKLLLPFHSSLVCSLTLNARAIYRLYSWML